MRAMDGLDLHSLWPNLPSRLTNQNSLTKPYIFIQDKFSYVFIPLYLKKKTSLRTVYMYNIIYIHHPYISIHIYTLLYILYDIYDICVSLFIHVKIPQKKKTTDSLHPVPFHPALGKALLASPHWSRPRCLVRSAPQVGRLPGRLEMLSFAMKNREIVGLIN